MNKLKDFFKYLNVSKIYFCSGSRNSSLLKILEDFEVEHHFNEQTASFMALGEAKMTRRPVVVCVTSGSAVAQCLPAMVEAFHSFIPLIILSADRPLRLKDSFSPQTINQENIFQDFCRSYLTEETLINNSYEYPMHINVRIDDAKKNIPIEAVVKIDSDSFIDLYQKANSPLFLFSYDLNFQMELLETFLKSNEYIFCEALTPYQFRLKANIKYESELVAMLENKCFDLIVKIGQTPVSKIWRLLDNTYNDIPVISIGQEKTGLGRGYFLENLNLSPPLIIKNHINFIKIDPQNLMLNYPNSEVSILSRIFEELTESSIVFMGNSMPIRYADFFKDLNLEFIASRGASGIDGQIATAIGVAKATDKKVHAILGDLTFLYDLACISQTFPKNLTLHILNNSGGRIFERVKVPTEIINQHDLNLVSIANAFLSSNQIKIYEIDNEQTNQFWKEL